MWARIPRSNKQSIPVTTCVFLLKIETLFCCAIPIHDRRIISRRKKFVLTPPTFTKVWFSSSNYKTGHIASPNLSKPDNFPPWVVWDWGDSGFDNFFYFSYVLTLEVIKYHLESSQNHNISQNTKPNHG